MKKTIICITILTILLMTIFTGSVYADTLDDFSVSVDKKLIHPSEQVILKVAFGKPLGSFTIKVDFDDDIFEYVSTENGTGSAEGDKVTVEYSELTTTKDDTKITFKAKEGLKTSNPTNFTVTGTNLKSESGTTSYDDISSGKVETVTVEPIYTDYTLSLEPKTDIIEGKETDFILTYSSAMGRPYAKARLEGEIKKAPDEGTAKLEGFSTQDNAKFDIIDDGWGNAQGYAIGGEDISQELNLKGTFSKAGEYTVTLRLVDREKSDETIVEKDFDFIVKPTEKIETQEEMPEELPKTGKNIFLVAIIAFLIAIVSVAYITKKYL